MESNVNTPGIFPLYYTKQQLQQLYLGSNVQHFLQKPRVVVVSTYSYTIIQGDDLYSLAAQIFNDESYWPYIADINFPKRPDDYVAGEVIQVPLLICQDVIPSSVVYG